MTENKVQLRDPLFAAILAFLVPGLGHFYQRRFFKGALYSVCILGTFFFGMRIGHGQVVYFQWSDPENRTLAYLCQFWTGLPALPALAQAKLRSPDAFALNFVPERISAPFHGTVYDNAGRRGTFAGTIELIPDGEDSPRLWTGKFTGQMVAEDASVEIEGTLTRDNLGDRKRLDPAVAPSPRRWLNAECEIRTKERDTPFERARIEGYLPRSLWNSYAAPLSGLGEPSELSRAHKELGAAFEIGVLFTMVAGLLNVLAIYDALEGPAYGADDEKTLAQNKKREKEGGVPV
jgi:hypothetical protein